MSTRGRCSLTADYSVLSDWGAYSGVDAFAKHVAAQVRRDLHIPPVVIAHGFGVRVWRWRLRCGTALVSECGLIVLMSQGYLAQKYLESFPAAAVVFVGAVGPRPGAHRLLAQAVSASPPTLLLLAK